MPPQNERKERKTKASCFYAGPWKETEMSNRQKQMEKLDKINDERMAAGLEMFNMDECDAAEEWKKGDGAIPVKEDGSVVIPETKPTVIVEKESDGSIVIEKEEVTDLPDKGKETVAESSLPDPAKVGDSESNPEVEELKRELARLKTGDGRARVLSDELRELKERFAEETKRADLAVAEARSSSKVDLSKRFTEDELDEIDVPTLEAMAKLRSEDDDARVNALVEQRLSEFSDGNAELREQLKTQGATVSAREQQFAEQAEAEMIKTVNEQIPTAVYEYVAKNPDKWEAWNRKGYAGTTEGALYASARETFDSNAVVSQLLKFASDENIEIPVKREKLPLKSTQRKSEAVIETNPNDKIYSYEDLTAKMNNFKRGHLPKGWNNHDFEKLIDKVTEAAEKGLLRDKNGTGKARQMPLF